MRATIVTLPSGARNCQSGVGMAMNVFAVMMIPIANHRTIARGSTRPSIQAFIERTAKLPLW